MSACLFNYGKGSSLVLATLGQAGTGRGISTAVRWLVKVTPCVCVCHHPERESLVLSPPSFPSVVPPHAPSHPSDPLPLPPSLLLPLSSPLLHCLFLEALTLKPAVPVPSLMTEVGLGLGLVACPVILVSSLAGQ